MKIEKDYYYYLDVGFDFLETKICNPIIFIVELMFLFPFYILGRIYDYYNDRRWGS